MLGRLLRGLLALAWSASAATGWWLRESQGWHGAQALAFALIAPIAFHPLVLAPQFAFAAWRRRGVPMPGRRLGTGLRAWAGEAVASVRTFWWLQPWFGERALPEGTNAGRVPVLFVHGYFCNRAVWTPLAARLAARGHATASVNLEPVFGPIDAYAGIVDEAVRSLRARTGAPKVALVCHSMGGLAARAWLRAHCADSAAVVVTLGTPHRGTELAAVGFGRNVRQMRRNSAWLQALADAEAARVRALFTVILTEDDNIVVPPTAQTLEGARETVVLRGLGHVRLAQDERAWRHVEAALDAAQGRPA